MSAQNPPRRLDYATPHRAGIATWFIRRQWIWCWCGLAAFVIGLHYAVYLDDQPKWDVQWAEGFLAVVLLLGGGALCLAGMVCGAVTASRTG